MGIFDNNRVKAELASFKTILAESETNSNTYDISAQIGKSLILTVINNSGSLPLNITGTDYSGTSGFWISQNFIRPNNVVLSGNSLVFPEGKSIIRLNKENVENFKKLQIISNLNGVQKLSLTFHYELEEEEEAENNIEIKEVTALNKKIKGGKFFRFRVIKMEEPSINNYYGIVLTDSSNNFVSKFIKAESKIIRGGYVVLEPGKDYYLDTNFFVDLNFIVTKFGVINAFQYTLVEVDEIPKFNVTQIFSTSSSIGPSLMYKRRDYDDKIVIRVRITNYIDGVNNVYFIPSNASGKNTNQIGTIIGEGKSNVLNINSVGEKSIIFEAVGDLNQINIGADLETGTEITVEIINHSNLSETYTKDYLESPIILNDKKIKIEKHKDNVSVYAHFENNEAWVSGNKIYVKDISGAGECVIEDFPNWKSGDSIGVMGFIPYAQVKSSWYSRETSTRLCIVTRLGNIYYNHPSADSTDTTVVSNGVAKFDLGIIYQTVATDSQLSSEKIPTKNISLADSQSLIYRYEPGLPDWNYNQHINNVGGFDKNNIPFGSGGQPPIFDDGVFKHIKMVDPFDYGTNPQNPEYPYNLGGYLSEPFAVHPKMTIFTPYVGINAKKNIILGTVNGGRTWYILHELGIGEFMSKFGNSLNYSSVGDYSSGSLAVSERLYINPTADSKEPEFSFKYKKPITISSITTTGKKTVATTNEPHNITDGSFIIFKKKSEGNFNFLENSGVNVIDTDFETNSVGNGRFYAAKVSSPTTFEILQCMGGVDEKIKTHHIHSANSIKDGAIISCGEVYPNGWILYIQIHQIDDFEKVDIQKYKLDNPYVIRLNSSKNAVQRPVGFHLNDDENQTFLFASDEGGIDRGMVKIDGRNETFRRSSSGLFLGNITDIDEMSKSICIKDISEASLGLIVKEGFYMIIGMSRKTYISVDLQDWYDVNMISSYQGSGFRELYFRSKKTIYKVSHN